jgi:diguanylate cyclase (GGDEF)-like protein
VSDKSKEYYSDIGLYRVIDPDNEPDDEWYKEFVDSGKEYNLTIGQDNDNSDVWTVFIDVRINDENGKFLGVSGMALEIQNLQELIRGYEEEYEVEIRFLDDEGQPQIESGNIEDYASETYKVPDSSEVGQITMSRNQIKPSYTITRYIDQLDWYMVVRDINPYPYTTDFMVILLNILIFAMLLVVSIISIRHIKIGAGTLFYESYIDNMTGLYNRRAYDDKLASLSQQDNLNNITVVVFDVNGLKKVNDTMGHAAGDELIKAAAKIINDSFGAYGKCYRTGGDEFVAILNKPIDDLGKITRNFELTQLEWKGENIKKLSISYGYVKGSDCDCSIDKMIYYADEHMYKKKKKYYNNTKNNRRKV